VHKPNSLAWNDSPLRGLKLLLGIMAIQMWVVRRIFASGKIQPAEAASEATT
jgi:hypothetical protein